MSASSSTSSSSSASSSSGHCQREEKGMGKFEPLHLHHTPPPPPPPPRHCKVKKHHRHRHHSLPPPPPPSHGRHSSVEHPDRSPPMDFSPPHHLSAPMDWPHHHSHKKDKLRVKPSKHLKKVHKLHRKLLKAYARHGGHRHHHMHFPPPKKGFFSSHFRHHHPPGCCLHSMDEEWFSMEEPYYSHREMNLHPRCRGQHPHPPHAMRPLIKSEVAGGEVALGSPVAMELSAELPNEGGLGGVAPPTSDFPPMDEQAPVVQAP